MNTPLADQLRSALPSAETQLEWIADVVRLGVRRPGTAENAATIEWCARRLAELGLHVEFQPVEATTSHPEEADIFVWPSDQPDQRIQLRGMTMPFTTPTRCAQFALTASCPSASPGQAMVEHVPFAELPVAALDDKVLGRHDPSGELSSHVQVLPFGVRLGKEIDDVVARGAGAAIGVVDAPWTTHDYFVPYDGVIRPIPGVWVDRESGQRLDALLAAGPVDVELTTRVEHRSSTDFNVIATAPGRVEDGWIVLGSHHDAPWASAVEDASGIAQVLAQATAWAAIAPAERPASIAFVLTAAHMSDGAGTQEFIRSWAHSDRIRFALHLEHVAAEAVAENGALRSTGRPEVRWWFASGGGAVDLDVVAASVSEAISAEELDRSLVLPPEIFGEMPPTDGGFFHLADIPMVNLLAAPMYLFDSADTIEMIHRPSLESTALAAIRITLDAADDWSRHRTQRADHD